jgi:hypothetical protein
MKTTQSILATALTLVVFLPAPVSASSPLYCSVTDASNPHFFSTFSGAALATPEGKVGLGSGGEFSANNVPCDRVGDDGDNEQGVSGAQMPLAGAACPYSEDAQNEQAGGGPVTIGHHGDDVYVLNTASVDVTWVTGMDGEDPTAALADQTCTGNGVITDDAATDPADCLDSQGSNVNILGTYHQDTDPVQKGTNDPTSGYSCFDAVDGNEWTTLNVGPFVGMAPGTGGSILVVDGNGDFCLDATAPVGHVGAPGEPCLASLDASWVPPVPNGIYGFSWPLAGTIASGVEE